MGFDVDEDILQDFLIEAGEILELLSEQLIELENNPEDKDLLNAIFRGFHTVKGGAGFLSLIELVDACHVAENVFDILRNGQRSVTADLMDCILQALDTVNDMFVQVQNREPLTPADPALLERLRQFSFPESNDATAPVEDVVEVAPVVADDDLFIDVEASTESAGGEEGIDEITEEEFERLLDELHGGGPVSSKGANSESAPAAAPKPAAASGEDITDDEFERLLDELHGEGQFITAEDEDSATEQPEPAAAPSAAPAAGGNENITDNEFEALLDEIHGQGNGPGVKETEPAPAAPVAKAPTPKAKIPKPAAPKVAASKAVAPAAKKVEAAPKAEREAGRNQQAQPQADSTVRVDTKRLDQIMNMVGELVLVRNRLVSLGISVENEDMSKAISNLDVVTADLQGAVMKTRMQPIKKVFGRFPRVVRDLARSLKKEINLVLKGEETDLDKNLVEALADPLVHLVRNSVDHGVEMPDVREQSGKSRTGTVTLSASQEGDHILLTIEDDGAGMDAEKLKNIAINKGILDVDNAARMSNEDAYNLIMAPGFSTKEEISDISGRGVGMDVVKTKITQLNGTVNIDSTRGRGTRFEIKVPLTLAILPTLMIVVGQQTFALPLAAVNEIFHLNLTKTNVVDGQLTIVVRDKAIPLFYLQQWLTKKPVDYRDRKEGHVVIVQIGTQQVGFVVDSLIGQEEVVIKPLDSLLQGTPGMAGATITSDGGIALILDIPSLLKNYASKSKITIR